MNSTMSARQRVSDPNDPRNLKRGDGQIDEIWPRDIPLEDRKPLGAGHRSFLATTATTTRLLRRGSLIRIEGHVLIHCVEGEVLLEQEPMPPVLLRLGQSVLLSDTTVRLTELPDSRYRGGAVIRYFLFTDRLLADLVPTWPRAAALVGLGAGSTTVQGFTPFRSEDLFGATQYLVQPAEFLQTALRLAMHRMRYPFLRLLFDRVVALRTKVQLFLESLLLRPDREHQAFLERWPGGRVALLRHMRRLALPSVAVLVQRRRFELAFSWSSYCGHSMQEITGALQVRYPGAFEAAYRRWIEEEKPHKIRGINLDDPADALLVTQPPFLAPFWSEYWHRPRIDAERERLEKELQLMQEQGREWCPFRDDIALDPMIRNMDPEYLRSLPDLRVRVPIDGDFLAMKSTGASTAISAHGINKLSGLEDALDLLAAA